MGSGWSSTGADFVTADALNACGLRYRSEGRVPGLRPRPEGTRHLVRPDGRAEALKGEPEIDLRKGERARPVNTCFVLWVRSEKDLGRSDLLDLVRYGGVIPEPVAEQLNQTMATDNNEDGA